MTLSKHDQAQELSARAELVRREGDRLAARDLFSQAAAFEGIALREIPSEKRRTRGILAVSYAALLFKAAEYEQAEAEICALLASGLEVHHREQLRELLQVTWEEQQLARESMQYSGDEILVALRGGEIGVGTAPADVAVHFMNAFNLLAFRAAELDAGLELRRKGPPSHEIQSLLQARATQPAAGSYRFSIRFVEPAQGALFPEALSFRAPSPKRISAIVVQVLRALESDSPAELEQAVPRADYRLALIRLARNVMPSGSALTEVEVRTAFDSPGDAVFLRLDQRRKASEAIKALRPPSEEPESEQGIVVGILRGLSLDNTWLQIRPEDGPLQQIRTNPSELDDVIGPMVNRKVEARVHYSRKHQKMGRGTAQLIDIELLED
ncbi:MAG: hypothetical protein ABJC13_22000 [Acidobacteriota bacterium]